MRIENTEHGALSLTAGQNLIASMVLAVWFLFVVWKLFYSWKPLVVQKLVVGLVLYRRLDCNLFNSSSVGSYSSEFCIIFWVIWLTIDSSLVAVSSLLKSLVIYVIAYFIDSFDKVARSIKSSLCITWVLLVGKSRRGFYTINIRRIYTLILYPNLTAKIWRFLIILIQKSYW